MKKALLFIGIFTVQGVTGYYVNIWSDTYWQNSTTLLMNVLELEKVSEKQNC